MSNSTTTIRPVSLQGELNLNSFKGEIHDFQGWNKKNGLNYGGLLSPFYSRSEANSNSVQYIDKNGNQYFMDGADFCRKDADGNVETLRTFSAGKVQKKVLMQDKNEEVYCWEYDATNDIFYYIVKISSSEFRLYNTKNPEYVVSLTGTFSPSGTIRQTPFMKLNPDNNLLYLIYAPAITGSVKLSVIDVVNEVHNQYSLSETFVIGNASCIFFGTIYSSSSKYVMFVGSSKIYIATISGNALTNISSLSTVYTITTEIALSLSSYCFTQDGWLHFNTSHYYDSTGQFTTSILGAALYRVNYSGGAYKVYVNAPVDSVTAASLDTSVYNSTYGAVIENLVNKLRTNIRYKHNEVLAAHTSVAKSGKYYAATAAFKLNQKTPKANPLFNLDDSGNVTVSAGEIIEYTKFRFLYNNDTLTGISLVPQEGSDYQGILLTPWYSVAEVEDSTDDLHSINISDNQCIYKDVDNNIISLLYSSTNPDIIGILDNRYILFNTDSMLNVYDLQNETFLQFASDWNNRLGDAVQAYSANGSNVNIVLVEKESSDAYDSDMTALEVIEEATDYYHVASSVNPFFEQNDIPFMSIQINPVGGYSTNPSDLTLNYLLTRSLCYQSAKRFFIPGFFLSSTEDNTCYNKKNEAYPLSTSSNILLNLPLFFRLYDSGINIVLIKVDDKTYVQYVYNQQLKYAYYLLSEIEGLSDVFVLYGQIYGVLDNKIVSLTVSDGVFSNSSIIVDIKGLQYVGSTPYQAFFYSKFNRSVYVFTGDRQLSLLFNATSLTDIYSFKYNPANNALFWNTNLGLIIIENNEACLIPGLVIEDIYFLDDRFDVVNETEIKEYSKNAIEGFEVLPLELETSFYGASETTLSIIDTWYIRFVSESHESGTITLSVKTWTDTGSESEEVEVNVDAADWDDVTDSYYLRFQPSLQRGVGVSLAIGSPFAIASLSAGFTPDTTMNSENNA